METIEVSEKTIHSVLKKKKCHGSTPHDFFFRGELKIDTTDIS